VTRKVKYKVRCWNCGTEAICPKCQTPVQQGTPFGQWLRELEGPLSSSNFSNHNLDYIWHHYRKDWFITIEEKRNGGKCRDDQLDTHRIVYQLLRLASKILKDTKRTVLVGAYGKKRRASVEYRGHFIISFENTTPDDSAWVDVKGRGGRKFTGDEVKEAVLHLLEHGALPEDAN